MTANLRRIPSAGDAAAEEIIALARDEVMADLLGCLVRRDAMALGRYGARQATVALRARSAALLHDALLATAIADVITQDDPRDVATGLALHHYVARELGLVPAEVFGAAVAGLPDDRVRDLFCMFGAREDVTLKAFGWLLVQTGDGPDFEPADPGDPARLRSLVLEAEQRRRRYLEGDSAPRAPTMSSGATRSYSARTHRRAMPLHDRGDACALPAGNPLRRGATGGSQSDIQGGVVLAENRIRVGAWARHNPAGKAVAGLTGGFRLPVPRSRPMSWLISSAAVSSKMPDPVQNSRVCAPTTRKP